jgi:hypothetical protein
VSFLVYLKPHFASSALMLMVMAWMIVEPSQFNRSMGFVAAFACFFCYTIFYGLEYDAMRRQLEAQRAKNRLGAGA